jgi:Uma2 family endonuclease
MSSVRHEAHDEQWLRQRSAAGLDVFDEVWHGVLHVVPPPSGPHQQLEFLLGLALGQGILDRGLRAAPEVGVFDPTEGERDFRVPDFAVYRPEHESQRGIEGRAELVVEIRSPDDETYEKFGFYGAHAVQQVLVILPGSRSFELYDLDGDGYRLAEPDAAGTVTIRCLAARLRTVETAEGPRLEVTIDGATSFV